MAMLPRSFRTFLVAGTAAALLLLAGCASLNKLDSDVTSYSHWPAGRTPSTYAFERLPSQQAQPEEQAQLEQAAREALSHAGFTEVTDAASSDVSVQVSARLTRQDAYYDPWYGDPWWGLRGGGWWGGRGRWWGPSVGFGLSYSTPRYDREVALLIRDRKTGAPLYETRAHSDGLSAGDAPLLSAMFEAALKDFPQPAVNPRRVSIPLS